MQKSVIFKKQTLKTILSYAFSIKPQAIHTNAVHAWK